MRSKVKKAAQAKRKRARQPQIIRLLRENVQEQRRQIAFLQRQLSNSEEERRDLVMQIQAWGPAPVVNVEKTPRKGRGSQPHEVHDLEPVGYTAEELLSMSLKENPDGGYCQFETGELWETVEDYKEHIGYLKKKGLPMNTPSSSVLER